MKVTSNKPSTRELTLSAPVDELAALVVALRSARRSKAQLSRLHQLATLIVESDADVDAIVRATAVEPDDEQGDDSQQEAA